MTEQDRICPICGADLSGHRTDAEVCGDRCRRERNRLRRLLAGEGDGPYRTVEDYLNRRHSRASDARRSLTGSAAS
ncbi:MAG TPA: hypothetical protein VJU14_10905 [Solirubrobacterales bacterium]|nr:hypothetical protein [Solirubrobacterales bacterium]